VLSSMIGRYDPSLVIFAALISLAAAYTTLEITDHLTLATGRRRIVWTFVAAVSSVLAIWSMQCIITLSLHNHVIVSYDVQVETASFILGLVFSLLGAFMVNARAWGVSRIAIGGMLFGVAMVTSNALGIRAIQLDGHAVYRLSMFIAAAMIAPCAAMVAFLLGSGLQRARPREHVLWRFIGGLLFTLGNLASYYYLMSGVQVSMVRPFQHLDPEHTPLAFALGIATFLIVLGALAAVLLESQASSEHQRAFLFNHLYTRERQVSATLQKALLPVHLPTVAGLAFSSVYLPHSDEAYVGGDWYDAFMLPDKRVAISLGDVAGHGLAAALTMNVVRHALRACAVENATPSRVLSRTNHILLTSDHPAIVTAVFAVFDQETSTLEFACAGHSSPIVIAPSGHVQGRIDGDPPLGVFEEMVYTDQRVNVPAGSMIALYTDGCTEYDRDVIHGERRFVETCGRVMKRGDANPAKAIADRLFARRVRNDDAAIFCVKLESAAIPLTPREIDESSQEQRAALL
jgi:serine phosphatase RsbU (regulator of sigma subunit)/NO-binding membrane sensor protein with MHYT domain